MDKGTLIDVVAMIDARIAVHENDLNEYQIKKWKEDEDYFILLTQRDTLAELKWCLQNAIDADVAAMESNTGE
jgi:hypothetical protein